MIISRIHSCLSIFIGILSAGAITAFADEYPSEIRVITPATATSDCIGDLKTPVCAVETFMACTSRREMSLCHRVGVTDISLPKESESTRYRILSVKILEEKDIPPDLRDSYWYRPSYADITVLEYIASRPRCQDECTYSYSAKPTSDGWKIVAWALWGHDQ